MSLGHMFIASCLTSGSTYEFLNHGDMTHLFKANEAPVYEFVKEYVKKYGQLPSTATVEVHTKDELPEAPDAAGFYYDELTKRYTGNECKLIMQEANKFLQLGSMVPEKALETLTDGVMKLTTKKFGRKITDFRDAYDLVWSDYVHQMKGDDNHRFMTGWPTLDEMTGGLAVGDKMAIVGRPAAGKTWQLIYAMLNGWYDTFGPDPKEKKVVANGQSRLLFSMEMKPLPINQRLASIVMSMPYSEIDKAMLSTQQQKQLKEGLWELKGFGAPFWVVDGNLTATVDDMMMIARQLKPDAIGIDGGYLVKHPSIKDRYQRVAENADLMKQQLADVAPLIVSWQFARSKDKGKKGEAPKKDLDDIGYTDAIGQVSSIVAGIMQKESIETVIQREIDILKGRKGEVGKFTTNWNFHTMDFSEYVEPSVEDLQFL